MSAQLQPCDICKAAGLFGFELYAVAWGEAVTYACHEHLGAVVAEVLRERSDLRRESVTVERQAGDDIDAEGESDG